MGGVCCDWRRCGAAEPVPLHRIAHQGSAIAEFQLAHAVGPVRLDGLDAELQPRRDFLVGMTLCEQTEDGDFAGTKAGLHNAPSYFRVP